ncbi:hypothetical protein TUM3794_20700 [Shewanella colwelliana]|uniref:Uncharacterized protein n=1 Tax=Shewanella colwelliana TaxID=23 RepID=A0ABQ4P0P8_SHECO|nr:hypothetical protein [Shewanella colwelliana]GIU41080.1 hypothetical protein TUM3794_20700 [Shewanella colwelliana]
MRTVHGKCFKALLRAQARYLIALRECITQKPKVGEYMFNMSPESVSMLCSLSESDWAEYVNSLNFWVLATRKDFSDSCLFEYWVKHLNTDEDIGVLINNRLPLSIKDNEKISLPVDFYKNQASLFEVVLRALFLSPSFSQGLLLLTPSVLNEVEANYFDFNTSHYYDSVPPLFLFNENIPLESFFDLSGNGISCVEHSLFSLSA